LIGAKCETVTSCHRAVSHATKELTIDPERTPTVRVEEGYDEIMTWLGGQSLESK
jgi:hypothetical protein